MTDAALDAGGATWRQAEEHIRAGCLAVLPFGAQEQHGPHLPLSTDTVMATGLARRLAGHVPSLLLPAVGYGETWNSDGFPGTVSLGFDTVRLVALDIAGSLHRQGVRGLVVVNGDFGNQTPLRLAAREARERWGFPVLVVDYPGLEEVAAEVCTTEPARAGFYHADEVETSVVLALEPGLVRMDLAAAEYPEFPPTYGATPVPLRQVSSSGVFGDPTTATAEKGERLLSGLTERALAVLLPFAAAALGRPAG